jgi:ornithine carbamoyltransferase
VSFEAGMYQMGGSVVHLTTGDSQFGSSEPIDDSARVISRMVDLVMIRTYGQKKIENFARYSRVPVINGLTNEFHPCQILADMFTFIEHRGSHQGQDRGLGRRRQQHGQHLAAGCGDPRISRCMSARQAATRWTPSRGRHSTVQRLLQACSAIRSKPAAVRDLVTTDVWTSMGYEAENEARKKAFADWCVDSEPDAPRAARCAVHALPAGAPRRRGRGVEVIDGPQSVVWDEAENRMHVQKALMEYLLLGRL